MAAAVCGQLEGTYFGVGGIPARWREQVVFSDQIQAWADRLVAAQPTSPHISPIGPEKAALSGIKRFAIQEILKREYVNSGARPELRSRFLDLIDEMATSNLIGTDELMRVDDR